jgi:hypothetical protein
MACRHHTLGRALGIERSLSNPLNRFVGVRARRQVRTNGAAANMREMIVGSGTVDAESQPPTVNASALKPDEVNAAFISV